MTPRQKRFVDEYLRDANGTRAAIRAGYAEVSARHHAHNLLRRPEIAAAIAEAEAARAERLRVSADRVLEELARVAFADLSRLVEWGPEGATVKAWGSVPGDETAAVAEVVVGPAGVRLRLHDKLRALDALCRHLGLYSRPGLFPSTPPVDHASNQERILARLAQLAEEIAAEKDEEGEAAEGAAAPAAALPEAAEPGRSAGAPAADWSWMAEPGPSG